MMRTIPVKMKTVEIGTGRITGEQTVQFGLAPPEGDACQVCGHEHEAALPHNAKHMYYQYAFYGATGRWPTWADAVAHCSPFVQARWREGLESLGHDWSEPAAGIAPIAHLGPETDQ